MTHNHDATLEFLGKWATEGPWILTAIDIERKGIETVTFEPSDEVALRKWLAKWSKSRNYYFHVNPALRPLSKKAEREDISSLGWLHVDLDPRAGENIDEERARALKLLQEPPGGLPVPTAIIFSGGGYQGFWRLKDPMPIGGQEAAYEEAARYNMQLEITFSADNCHNVDRIMRIPGTINWPDERKRKKGRVPALATLVSFTDAVYPLSTFSQAPKAQVAGPSGHCVTVSGNIDRVNGVDDPRLEKVHDLAKVVIVQGRDPEDPKRFGKEGGTSLDRSQALFYVCCEMVRGGCDDDLIYAVITDSDFGISASVIDKGSMSEKYAVRQIGRARENAVEPKLQELNDRHAVIGNWSGKCRIIEEVEDHALGRTKISKQTFQDFSARYMNQYVKVGEQPKVQLVPLGKWWLGHPKRRQYDTVVFAPGREIPNSYNLWKGFACDSKPGDCSKSLAHIKDVLCQGVEEHYEYLLGWMASAVQKPDRPGYSAVVLRGRGGTGKSFFVTKIFGSLFGRHMLQVSDPKHIVGSFNAHLRDCVILFAEEAFYAGDKKHESILKMLVTEDMLIIEPKGVDAEVSANCVHLLMASNESWVVPASLDDRRFFVLDVSISHKEERAYFDGIQKELDNGGREALLHYLLTYDIFQFNVRSVPKTSALQDQKLHSMDAYEEWWFNKLRCGLLVDTHAIWQSDLPMKELQNDFIRYARAYGVTRRGNATKLSQMLQGFMPKSYPRNEQRSTPVEIVGLEGVAENIKRPYFYLLPTLEECRKHWDDNFGGPYVWQTPVDDGLPESVPF